MRDQAGVGHAVVRRNAGFRLEQRKHRGRRASGLIRLRRPFQGSHGLRTLGGIILDPLAHLVEMERAPARRIIQLRELVVRHVLRIRDIGRESLLRVEDSDKFVADLVRRLLDRIKPGKIGAVEELDRCEARKMINLRA